MPEVMIRDSVWREFVAVAQKKRTAPEALAQRVLRDYVQQVSDEELLVRSSRAARRAPFSIRDSESIVREFRRRTRR
jgi:hypothetical protein